MYQVIFSDCIDEFNNLLNEYGDNVIPETFRVHDKTKTFRYSVMVKVINKETKIG